MSERSFDHIIKILLIGDPESGKTSILLKYSSDTFSSDYINTLGIDFRIKHLTIKNYKIKLQIWDTAGRERFKTITTAYYKGAQGIFIVYDVTNRKSFENIEQWLKNIDKYSYSDSNIVKILIGNKIDINNKRVVTTTEGQELADLHQMIFFETSAKTGENIEDAFVMISSLVVDNIKKYRTLPSVLKSNDTPTRSCCNVS